MAPLIDGERKDWEQVSKVSSDKKPIKYKLNPENFSLKCGWMDFRKPENYFGKKAKMHVLNARDFFDNIG